ncbi:MAG: ribosome maturation factor RimM [Desertimonas sp.]
MDERPDGVLEIGVLRRAHGVRGQISVELSTDRPERVEPGARWWAGGQWLTVAAAQRHQDRWLVTFDEIAGREQAQAFTNQAACAEPLEDPDALWVHQLIGAQVVERDGTARGRCVAVIDNPAADLLELDGGALVPVVFVTDHGDGRIVIDPPDGLFDLGED